MAAYLIFIQNGVNDAEGFKTYGGLAAKTPPRNLKPLAAYGPIETLEGDEAKGAVMLEFPTMDDAKAWYNSPEYKTAAAQRMKSADYRVLLVQGI